MKVSKTEAERNEFLASPGPALVRIGNTEYRVAKTGNPGVTLTLHILASSNEGDEGKVINYQTIYLRTKDGQDDTKKLSQLLLAVMPEIFEQDDEPDIDPSDRDFLADLINRKMVVCFGQEPDQKGTQRNILITFGTKHLFYYPEEEYDALTGTRTVDSSDVPF